MYGHARIAGSVLRISECHNEFLVSSPLNQYDLHIEIGLVSFAVED
jgi:hypothetical protein